MREVLFRAKAVNRDPNGEYRTDYKNGDWVYGLVTKLYDSRFPRLAAEMTNEDGVGGIEVDYTTISEWTGLTDIHGDRIFEGDIITKNSDGSCGYIKWDNCHAGFVIAVNDDAQCTLSAFEEYEIVANIYYHPIML